MNLYLTTFLKQFNQQWLPTGISLSQSLSCCLSDSHRACLRCSSCSVVSCCLLDLNLSFLACLRCSSCSALSCCLLNLRLAFLVCLLARSLFSCLLARALVFLREHLQFCSASTGSMINFFADPRSDAGLQPSW